MYLVVNKLECRRCIAWEVDSTAEGWWSRGLGDGNEGVWARFPIYILGFLFRGFGQGPGHGTVVGRAVHGIKVVA